jgi:cell division protein FtsA
MMEGRPLIGIDVGSSRVAVVVCSPEDDRLFIHGCGQARHDGARRGVIAKLDEVSEAVRIAAEEAEAMASVPVEEAVVGIGGVPIQGNPSTASVPVTGKGSTVSVEDVQRALAACAHVSIPADYRVLDIIPGGFALDGQPGMEHPVGMPGRRLDASAYVLYTNTTHADTVEQAVNHAAIVVRQLVYEPLAAAEAVLFPDERELGCLLLDIGHSSTEWVLYAEGGVVASSAMPIGGRLFTADLAAMMQTTTAAAEQIKRQVGASLCRDGLDLEAVEVPALGGGGNQVHSLRFAAEILYERGRDLLIGVHRALVHAGLDRVPRGGLVLTGGGARLEGLEELAEEIFGFRARIGKPRALTGLAEPVSGPEWAVACGLAWIVHKNRDRLPTTRQGRGGILAWLRNALGDFFELGGGL